MPWFSYHAIDGAGKPLAGREYGKDVEEVTGRLNDNGLVVLDIRMESGFNFDLTRILGWISNYELKIFFVNLATLLGAGCSLHTSLASLAEQTENRRLADILNEVDRDIVSGRTFTEALARHPKVFPQLFINLVRAGEEGGTLEEVILRYATYTEKQETMRRKVRGALVLPAFLAIAATGVTIALLTYVFPTFMELFRGKEHMLPGPTKLLITISDFIRFHWLFLGGASVAIPLGLWLFAKTPIGNVIFCYLQLRLPVLGRLFRKMQVAQLSHTMASLLKSGVPALRAIKITEETIPNIFVQQAMAAILENVRKGGNYVAPMSQYPYLFPKMVTLMVQVGETTGTLDAMFLKVAEYFDAEVDEALQMMINMIEPAMTVIMGGVVLFIALAMFLPLFDMTRVMR